MLGKDLEGQTKATGLREVWAQSVTFPIPKHIVLADKQDKGITIISTLQMEKWVSKRLTSLSKVT